MVQVGISEQTNLFFGLTEGVSFRIKNLLPARNNMLVIQKKRNYLQTKTSRERTQEENTMYQFSKFYINR